MDKRMRMLSLIVFFAVVIILGIVIYSNATKSNEKTIEEKVLTETKYLEVKLVNMANRINNITTQNYKVTTKEIEGESEDAETSSNNSGNTESGSSVSSSNDSYNEYNMERVKELSQDKDEDINWDDIQKEIEEIYTVISTITLDLYQTSINQEDILKFNGYLDDLASSVEKKEEENTLKQLCNMYSCITKFTDKVTSDDVYKTTIRTKEHVLKAYSFADAEDWEEVMKNLQYAIDAFSILLTNTNVNYGKQVNINKTYVILNELKNAANKKERDVFFIKYKNLLEEMNSM